MKILFRIFLALIVLLVAVIALRDFLIKSAIEAGAKYVAGAEVKIGGFSSSILRQSVRITGLKVYNPQGFPAGAVMVDVPEVAVSCDVPALFSGKLHVPYLRLDLKEVRVIRNKDGKMNVNSLNFAQQPATKKAQGAPAKSEPKKELKMLFDLVSINIGRVVIEDYSRGKATPKLTTLDINIKNKEYRNITDPAKLGSIIMVSALAPAGIDSAFKLGTRALEDAALSGAEKSVGGSVSGVLDSIGGLFKK